MPQFHLRPLPSSTSIIAPTNKPTAILTKPLPLHTAPSLNKASNKPLNKSIAPSVAPASPLN